VLLGLSSLYDQNFGEDDDDDEDDEVYGAEQEKMIGIIGKRTDWLPGDPEEEERKFILFYFSFVLSVISRQC
jgi:hypothetical protein